MISNYNIRNTSPENFCVYKGGYPESKCLGLNEQCLEFCKIGNIDYPLSIDKNGLYIIKTLNNN